MGIPQYLSASHLAGGELTYECLGKNSNGLNRYRVRFTLYRDCSNSGSVNFDASVAIYAFRASDGGLTDSLVISSFTPDFLSLSLNDTCAELPPGVCYERAVYSGIMDLPDNNFGYHLTWSRCCRNASILNISNPNITGTTLTVQIPPTALCDNSPKYLNEPEMALCLGRPYSSFITASDSDGDSLSYHLLAPYTGGSSNDPIPVPLPPPYNTVLWNPPFNTNNILGGSPPLTLEASSGLVQAIPDVLGQYTLSVAVRSWRNSTLLTEVRRDYQINVLNCLADIAPVVTPPTGPQINGKELTFYAGQENCFSFLINDSPDNFVVFTASGSIFSPPSGNPATYNGAGYGSITGRLCWSPDCSLSGFSGTVILSSNDNNNCPAPNYTIDTFFVKVIPPVVPSPLLRCVSAENDGSVKLDWMTTETIPGFKHYALYRSSDLTPEAEIITLQDSTRKSYTDIAPFPYPPGLRYRIQTFFDCPDTNPAEVSPSIPLIQPQVSLQNSVNASIQWEPYTGWENPLLDVWSYPPGEAILTGFSGNGTTWSNCDFTGYFQIQGQDPASGCLMKSAPSDSVRMYLDPPDVLKGCTASVMEENKGVQILWLPFTGKAGFKPVVYRKNPGVADYTFIHEIEDPATGVWLDSEAKPEDGIVEYKLGFRNPCQVDGDWSDPFHSFYLNVEKSQSGFISSWTPAYLLGGIQEYEVQIREREEINAVWLVKSRLFSDQDRFFKDEEILTSRENYCYRIRAYPSPEGCTTHTWSNTSCERPLPDMAVPGAFSPNGDGLNDFFKLPTFAIETFFIQIFDRWGNEVFQSRNKDFLWDGNKDGSACPEGIYAYQLTANGYERQVIQKNGTITLIR